MVRLFGLLEKLKESQCLLDASTKLLIVNTRANFKMIKNKEVKFVDLFAGLGGIRIGFEQALEKAGLVGKCVFTSEIKPHAKSVYEANFSEQTHGDITAISPNHIPDFDVLLAGFPCQPFSAAGARKGFMDTRGTLFFNIEKILKAKNPSAFLLENVEGLVTHDRVNPKHSIGRTLETILSSLKEMGYFTSWAVLDSSKYGVPQRRKRIYIVGCKKDEVDLEAFEEKHSCLDEVFDKNPAESLYIKSELSRKLFSRFKFQELWGKQIKDKRGGENNIHSWDLELKGPVSPQQKDILEDLLKQRRRKSWSGTKGIPWSDGMPLTLDEIETFRPQNLFDNNGTNSDYTKNLKHQLDDLVRKGYLAYEKPKKVSENYSTKGYNIVVGKLSFGISNILHPKGHSPTLVATDVTRIAVADKNGVRRLSINEGLRLFGFPKNYRLEQLVKYTEAFDLLGNSVCINVINIISQRLIKALYRKTKSRPFLVLKANGLDL